MSIRAKTFETSEWGPALVFELGTAGSSGTLLGCADDRRAETRPEVGSHGGGAYGLELGHLLQVIEPSGVSPVPLSPAVVLGIMNFHGRIVTVVDPAPILGLAAPAVAGPDSRVLLLRQGQANTGNVGLYVGRVENIVPAQELQPSDVPPGPCVRWVLQHGHRLVNIIQVELLLDGLIREFGREPRQGVI